MENDSGSKCDICGTEMPDPGHVGRETCPHCGAVYEYEEGARIVLDDELRAVVLSALLSRKEKK